MSLRGFWSLALIVVFFGALLSGSRVIAAAFSESWPVIPASFLLWVPLWLVVNRGKPATDWNTKQAMFAFFLFAWTLIFALVALVNDSMLSAAAVFVSGSLLSVLVYAIDLSRNKKQFL